MQDNTNSKQGQQEQEEEEVIRYCNFCNKRAEFQCGNCQDISYCGPEHQRADWPNHKRRCIHPVEKLNQLKKYILNFKKIFFEKLAGGDIGQCEQVGENLVKVMEQVRNKNPTPENQLQYGAYLCTYIKVLIKVKNFNDAQQLLNHYLKEKMNFLKDLSNIPVNEINKYEDNIDPKTLQYVQKKLRLISVVANLTHQLVRNSIPILQILLKHFQKFYGPNSLEVSNIYFYFAQYLNFMNQRNKSLACFLVADRIRGGCASCCYNAALILTEDDRYHKAIEYYKKSLETLQKKKKTTDLYEQIYEGLAYCYKRLNHFENTVLYLEKALCQCRRTNKNPYRQKVVLQTLKILSKISRASFKDDEVFSFPKQIKARNQKEAVISKQNIKDYKNKGEENEETAKIEEWEIALAKQNDFMKFQSKIPPMNPLVENVLFKNHFLEKKSEKNPVLAENSWIKIDLPFMESLTAHQVKYMDEINTYLIDCKELVTAINAFQSSKLLATLNEQKLKRFYELNPHFRPKPSKIQDYLSNFDSHSNIDQTNKLNYFSKQFVKSMESNKK